MRRLACIATALFAIVAPAWAGFESGVDAFNAGDYAVAQREWRPLAERGVASAQYNMGILYNYGHGVQQDFATATEWYRRAAGQDHLAAQVKLGNLLAAGRGGVTQDYPEAMMWFHEAARRGVAVAQYNVAMLYLSGRGVEKDDVQALMWITLAIEGGIEEVEWKRDKLVDRMALAEVAEAKRLIASFAPSEPVRDTAAANEPIAPPSMAKPPPPAGMAMAEPELPSAAPEATVEAPVAATMARPEANMTMAIPEPSASDMPGIPMVAPSADHEFAVHLASYRSRKAAERGWRILSEAYGDVLGGLGPVIAEVDLGQDGVYFRLQAGPLPDRDRAATLCDQLKQRDLYCLPAF